MHAASRATLDRLSADLDNTLTGSIEAASAGAQTGADLFEVVELLDADRTLRMALVDQTIPADRRVGLAESLLNGKVSATALEIVSSAVRSTWSNTRDLRTGLVELGRRALLRAAGAQGQKDRVGSELYQLARLLEKEPQLEMLLADRLAPADNRRDLFAKVLYGKVSSITEALALQVASRPGQRPVEGLDAVCDFAAALDGKTVARVRSVNALSDAQAEALGQKLEKIYGSAMSVHSEVDTSLLGGAVIRVRDEVIDGSTAGKLEKLRRNLA
ncbi:F0F1 ATP synthase subunit delta [Corynebacterium terpenotabidum]|uniref:ATP synthase subunit delta n=1 Tax=Corynebacterium terpenotabidum Y-11 TaxID=1200352 RepID=S4XHG7_9CORY|nr:F0F1 ATP synthase subunit delta [Corynebacterium terpenotabidum]AGP31125.1 F0F1 ATP synthase subunit delta [Corynebacterium terpenotabidum Y-11]